MNIHEYQAKDLFEKFGVPSPKGRMAESPEEAKKIAEEINGQTVIKAQVHAWGRGDPHRELRRAPGEHGHHAGHRHVQHDDGEAGHLRRPPPAEGPPLRAVHHQ